MTQNRYGMIAGLRRIFDFVPGRRRWQALGVLGFMLLGALAELVTIGAVVPFLALIADSNALLHHPAAARLLAGLGLTNRADAIAAIAVAFCVLAVLAAAIRIGLAWASQNFTFKIGYDIGLALYERMLFQPYSFHVSQNSSSIVSSINKVQKILNQMLLPAMQGLTAVVISIFILGGLLFIDASVALASALSFAAIYVGVSFVTRKRLRRNGRIIAHANTARIKAVQEGLGGIRDVLIDNSQPIYVRKFAKIDKGLRDSQATNAMISATPRFAIESLGMVLIAGLAYILDRQEGGIATALPTLGALALGAQRLLPLLQQAYNGWSNIVGNQAMFHDVMDLLERPLPGDFEARRNVVPLPFERAIEVRDLSFRYVDEGPDVLHAVSLDIVKGARIGLIGKTGSGKSTLSDLLMGLLTPSDGFIAIDGKPLAPADVPGWQSQIAHVPQHIYLADGPFLENVAFGVPAKQIDRQRVEEACRKADIHDFIATQPQGYDTPVGERGIKLSGGQRQRIGIARALYKNASVLFLDEATSALDDATETAVVSAVERLGAELTVIMIAHRLTTLRGCDTIYRLSAGRVVQKGDYQTVIGSANDGEPALAQIM